MTVAAIKEPVRTPKPSDGTVDTRYPYPGIPTTCDGAEAVVHVEIPLSGNT